MPVEHYYIGDLHLGGKAKFRYRPQFHSLAEMDAEIIARLRATVPDSRDHHLWLLGHDFRCPPSAWQGYIEAIGRDQVHVCSGPEDGQRVQKLVRLARRLGYSWSYEGNIFRAKLFPIVPTVGVISRYKGAGPKDPTLAQVADLNFAGTPWVQIYANQNPPSPPFRGISVNADLRNFRPFQWSPFARELYAGLQEVRAAEAANARVLDPLRAGAGGVGNAM